MAVIVALGWPAGGDKEVRPIYQNNFYQG